MAGETVAEMLSRLVDSSGGSDACHPFTGAPNAGGYGVLPKQYEGSRLAHRAALALSLGRPVEGVARHSCDNPPCCNAHHLLEGTQADNVDDAWSRGRTKGGRRDQATCKYGHPLTGDNLRLKPKKSTRGTFMERRCRTCDRKRNTTSKARQRAQKKEMA